MALEFKNMDEFSQGFNNALSELFNNYDFVGIDENSFMDVENSNLLNEEYFTARDEEQLANTRNDFDNYIKKLNRFQKDYNNIIKEYSDYFKRNHDSLVAGSRALEQECDVNYESIQGKRRSAVENLYYRRIYDNQIAYEKEIKEHWDKIHALDAELAKIGFPNVPYNILSDNQVNAIIDEYEDLMESYNQLNPLVRTLDPGKFDNVEFADIQESFKNITISYESFLTLDEDTNYEQLFNELYKGLSDIISAKEEKLESTTFPESYKYAQMELLKVYKSLVFITDPNIMYPSVDQRKDDFIECLKTCSENYRSITKKGGDLDKAKELSKKIAEYEKNFNSILNYAEKTNAEKNNDAIKGTKVDLREFINHSIALTKRRANISTMSQTSFVENLSATNHPYDENVAFITNLENKLIRLDDIFTAQEAQNTTNANYGQELDQFRRDSDDLMQCLIDKAILFPSVRESLHNFANTCKEANARSGMFANIANSLKSFIGSDILTNDHYIRMNNFLDGVDKYVTKNQRDFVNQSNVVSGAMHDYIFNCVNIYNENARSIYEDIKKPREELHQYILNTVGPGVRTIIAKNENHSEPELNALDEQLENNRKEYARIDETINKTESSFANGYDAKKINAVRAYVKNMSDAKDKFFKNTRETLDRQIAEENERIKEQKRRKRAEEKREAEAKKIAKEMERQKKKEAEEHAKLIEDTVNRIYKKSFFEGPHSFRNHDEYRNIYCLMDLMYEEELNNFLENICLDVTGYKKRAEKTYRDKKDQNDFYKQTFYNRDRVFVRTKAETARNLISVEEKEKIFNEIRNATIIEVKKQIAEEVEKRINKGMSPDEVVKDSKYNSFVSYNLVSTDNMHKICSSAFERIEPEIRKKATEAYSQYNEKPDENFNKLIRENGWDVGTQHHYKGVGGNKKEDIIGNDDPPTDKVDRLKYEQTRLSKLKSAYEKNRDPEIIKSIKEDIDELQKKKETLYAKRKELSSQYREAEEIGEKQTEEIRSQHKDFIDKYKCLHKLKSDVNYFSIKSSPKNIKYINEAIQEAKKASKDPANRVLTDISAYKKLTAEQFISLADRYRSAKFYLDYGLKQEFAQQVWDRNDMDRVDHGKVDDIYNIEYEFVEKFDFPSARIPNVMKEYNRPDAMKEYFFELEKNLEAICLKYNNGDLESLSNNINDSFSQNIISTLKFIGPDDDILNLLNSHEKEKNDREFYKSEPYNELSGAFSSTNEFLRRLCDMTNQKISEIKNSIEDEAKKQQGHIYAAIEYYDRKNEYEAKKIFNEINSKEETQDNILRQINNKKNTIDKTCDKLSNVQNGLKSLETNIYNTNLRLKRDIVEAEIKIENVKKEIAYEAACRDVDIIQKLSDPIPVTVDHNMVKDLNVFGGFYFGPDHAALAERLTGIDCSECICNMGAFFDSDPESPFAQAMSKIYINNVPATEFYAKTRDTAELSPGNVFVNRFMDDFTDMAKACFDGKDISFNNPLRGNTISVIDDDGVLHPVMLEENYMNKSNIPENPIKPQKPSWFSNSKEEYSRLMEQYQKDMDAYNKDKKYYEYCQKILDPKTQEHKDYLKANEKIVEMNNHSSSMVYNLNMLTAQKYKDDLNKNIKKDQKYDQRIADKTRVLNRSITELENSRNSTNTSYTVITKLTAPVKPEAEATNSIAKN